MRRRREPARSCATLLLAALCCAAARAAEPAVLHQGIAMQGGWPMGRVAIVLGALVLLAWIPIRQRPGFGTLCNVVVIGLVAKQQEQPAPSATV